MLARPRVSVARVGYVDADIDWQPVATALEYIVAVDRDGHERRTQRVTSTQAHIGGLQPSAHYVVSVTARRLANQSPTTYATFATLALRIQPRVHTSAGTFPQFVNTPAGVESEDADLTPLGYANTSGGGVSIGDELYRFVTFDAGAVLTPSSVVTLRLHNPLGGWVVDSLGKLQSTTLHVHFQDSSDAWHDANAPFIPGSESDVYDGSRCMRHGSMDASMRTITLGTRSVTTPNLLVRVGIPAGGRSIAGATVVSAS